MKFIKAVTTILVIFAVMMFSAEAATIQMFIWSKMVGLIALLIASLLYIFWIHPTTENTCSTIYKGNALHNQHI